MQAALTEASIHDPPGVFDRALLPARHHRGGRHLHERTAITLLNLFLGWTFIGWIIALIWAITALRRILSMGGHPTLLTALSAQLSIALY